ncbi:MAG: amidohydrolase family protein [Bacteroidota bacterium]
MKRRLITADKVFPVYRPMVEGAILVINEDGVIEDFVHPEESNDLFQRLSTHPDLETYAGSLVPGMINSHCHLELSFAKGLIPKNTGLPDFLKSVTRLRGYDRGMIDEAMVVAEKAMADEGIVGIGDISNTDHSLQIKSSSKMRYHTFVEVFDLHEDRAQQCFDDGIRLVNSYERAGLQASLVPHATYTVSSRLMSLLSNRSAERGGLLTLHNQETLTEDDFFLTGEGALASFLKTTGRFDDWMPSGVTALRSAIQTFDKDCKLMLVHNTFTPKEDVFYIKENYKEVHWCLCPKANLHIENKLPDLCALVDIGQRILIGTDSLASNDRLSLLEEMSVILSHDKTISFDRLLESATSEAAKFFGWDDVLGDFKKGKRPGVIWLKQVGESSGQVMSGETVISA